ncbi:MAG: hypothetical protein IKG44_05690 [Mogibacterium sp.]|nr:hypothetical protein [Mogibacterium sp.]
MGKGFDAFMENPYWRKIYEEAPGEHLKEYYRIMFETSPFVMGDDYLDEVAEARLKELWISKGELEYLKEHSGIAQARAFYQRCIDKLNEEDEEGLCVSAACLKCEIRNPWYKE